MLDVDTVGLAKAFRKPLVIIQGEMDVQVSLVDAQSLKAAAPHARLVIVPCANHVLKVEATRDRAQASYRDPDMPLAPGVVDALLALAREQ